MGISRSPVREAIRRLAVRGLISEQPRRGSFVTQLTRPLVSQVYDCRRALEGLAARRVVESDDAANHMALLSGIVADMGRARTRHDHVGMAEADYRFHLTLCKLTGNAWLIRLYDQLADQIQLMQTVDASAHASSETIDLMMTHGAIVEAIASRDPDAAELAAVTHIDLSEGLFFSEVPDIPDE
jgi:DNA-binding GntR family transcriptional regulator